MRDGMRDGVGRKVKWGQGKRKSDKMGVDLLVLFFRRWYRCMGV